MKAKTAEIRIYVSSKNFTIHFMLDFLKQAAFFEAVRFETDEGNKFKEFAFSESNFAKCVEKEEKAFKYAFGITLHDASDNEIFLYKQETTSFISIDIAKEAEGHLERWIQFTDALFERNSVVICACLYPENDGFWQQYLDPAVYSLYGRSLEGVAVIHYNDYLSKIDRKSLPGYSNYFNQIWFGSTWMMWYGHDYFRMIPKERFMSFDQAFEIRELPGGAVRIQLFEHREAYEEKASRAIQQRFRDYMAVDDVVEALEDAQNRQVRDSDDVAIEIITDGTDSFGTPVKQYRFYVDEQGVAVVRSQALRQITYGINEQGGTVFVYNEEMHPVYNSRLMIWTFPVSAKAQSYCEDIAEEMQNHFGISEKEAVDRINDFWSRNDLTDDRDIMYHESPEFWAYHMYSDNQRWWTISKEEIIPRKYKAT